MQTFLPFSDYRQSAMCLDNRRLGKQRVECLQILRVLTNGNPKAAWYHHPAAQMWKGYEVSLVRYGQTICSEWINRGFKDTCYSKISKFALVNQKEIQPPWLNIFEFHASHRSNLLRKDFGWYGKWGWLEIPGSIYWWPTKNGF